MSQATADRNLHLILTCEHAGNRVPPEWRTLFEGEAQVLDTHRGYDLGALSLARYLAEVFQAPLFASTYTRLICDLNRSPGHPALFSRFTRHLPALDRERIISSYYLPHRSAVESSILKLAKQGGRVMHIGIHTFTPNLDGQSRNADIGLLYDPQRPIEKEFCLQWRGALARENAGLRIRQNYPYRGQSDSLPTFLRKILPGNTYAGIELEVNQKCHLAGKAEWRKVTQVLAHSLGVVLQVDLFDTGES